MKQTIVFDFKNVPDRWAICYNDNCLLAGKCLRRYAAKQAPEQLESTYVVTSNATNTGSSCRWFVTNEPIQTAYGFKHLYDNVRHKDYPYLKAAITAMLGGRSNYYRYNSGERSLSPSQQQAIAQLMASMGYTDAPQFEHFRQELRFT